MVLVVKLWLGWTTQSLSVLAESLHTLLDSFSTLLSLITLTTNDRLGWHNVWSHGKGEIIGLLMIVAFLGFASFSLLIMAAQDLETPRTVPLAFNAQLVQVLALVIVVPLCLAIFKRHRSHILSSPLLRLNTQHTLRDVWLTLIVALGLGGVHLGYTWLDPVMTIILVLTLSGSGWQLINWQLPFMVQQVAIAPETLTQIAKQVEGVSHCYRVSSRGLVGRQVFVELHLGIHPEFMGVARTIVQRIEATIRTRYGPVKVSIYIVPNPAMGENHGAATVIPPFYPQEGYPQQDNDTR